MAAKRGGQNATRKNMWRYGNVPLRMERLPETDSFVAKSGGGVPERTLCCGKF